MSTLKVDNIRHNNATSDAITMASDGTCTAKLTSVNDGQLGNRRLNINGGFQVFQRSTSASSVGASGEGYFAPDRYRQSGTGNMRYTASQSTDVPPGFGFSNSLKYDCTTASGTVSPGHFVALEHRMEGQDVQVLCKGTAQAKQLTISFHVKSPKAGIHWVEVYDDDNNRHVAKSYTISSANTWQKIILTFPGDTTGAFNNDNGTSLRVFFWLMAGTTYTGGGTPPATWATFTANKRATGQVNVFDDDSNNFYITGIQFEVGDTATSFEHRRFGDELRRCMRYYEKTYPYGVAPGGSNSYAGFINQTGSSNVSGTMVVPIQYGVEKRAAPTLTAYNSSNGNSGTWYVLRNGASGHNSVTIDQSSTRRARLYFSVGAAWVVANAEGHFIADAEL